MKISKIKEKLKELIKSNSDLRQEIAELCSNILNSNSKEYDKLNIKDKELVEDLEVMDEIGEIKEPKILHMTFKEIEEVLRRSYDSSHK